MPMIQLLSKKREYYASEYARNIALANLRKIFAGEQTPKVRHQGGSPIGTLWFGTTPPAKLMARENQARRYWGFEPRRSWLSPRAVFTREVSVSYATGRLILGE